MSAQITLDRGAYHARVESSAEAPQDARGAAQAAIARMIEALAGLIRRGQADGSLRDDVPAEALAGVVFSAIHAWGFRRRNTTLPAELEGQLPEAPLNPFEEDLRERFLTRIGMTVMGARKDLRVRTTAR